MGSKGGVTLLGLLLILSALCGSGHSLRCYHCLNPGGLCESISNCSVNLDACLFVKAETRTYYQCWSFNNCNYEYLSKNLNEKKLQYQCCQKDLCNKSGATSITGTIALLVTPLLVAFWRLL